MAWAVASIPFWLLGAFFFYGACIAIPRRRPDETASDLGIQVVGFLLVCGIFFIIAAKIGGA
jgi:hypothetical protein